MAQYGKITHYDARQGTGTIAPEQGGDPLPFDTSGLQQQAQEPRSDQLYTYETQMGADGRAQAVNLQMEQSANARQQDPAAHGNQGGFDQSGESQNRANQDRASRLGVDEQPDREMRDSEVSGGSDFHPMEESQTDRNRQIQNERFEDSNPQGQNQQGLNEERGSHEGVSRAGIEQPARSGPTTSNNDQHGGSTFQPLEDNQSHNDRARQDRNELASDPAIQNPRGQNPRGQDARGQELQGQTERPPVPPSNPARRP